MFISFCFQGKRNSRAVDPAVDHIKNPQFLILLSENFREARSALSRLLVGGLATNHNAVNGPPAASVQGLSTTSNTSGQ